MRIRAITALLAIWLAATAAGAESASTRRLLPVGKPAPAFVLPRPDGGEISLSQALSGRKAVVVVFWGVG
ncbi:MAG: hypothetical protein ACK47B_13470 [Armatimonadota bacterium]